MVYVYLDLLFSDLNVTSSFFGYTIGAFFGSRQLALLLHFAVVSSFCFLREPVPIIPQAYVVWT